MAEPTPEPLLTCTMCDTVWPTLQDAIADESLELVGYQARFDDPTNGILLVTHATPECGTTVGITVGALRPLYAGPEYEQRATLGCDCSRQCLYENRLELCEAECDMAWARVVMQSLRRPHLTSRERHREPAIPVSPVRLQPVRPWPVWFSYLGAIGGCLDHLGIRVSRPWLYGGTGLAFMMNMQRDVDVAAPIAWDGLCVHLCHGPSGGMVPALEPNLGYRCRTVCACPFGSHTDLDAARHEAWELACETLAQARPCVGFELAHPEFAIICGHTRDSYFYVVAGQGKDAQAARGVTPWHGISPAIGWVRVQAVEPCEPAPDHVVVCEALAMAHARMSGPAVEGEFVLGLTGFDLWAEALEQGHASSFGHRCNAAIWAEMRAHGAAFLREAAQRLPGRADDLLAEAAGHYQRSADALGAVHHMHPMAEDAEGCIQCPEAAALIREAHDAEVLGLPLLGRIARELSRSEP